MQERITCFRATSFSSEKKCMFQHRNKRFILSILFVLKENVTNAKNMKTMVLCKNISFRISFDSIIFSVYLLLCWRYIHLIYFIILLVIVYFFFFSIKNMYIIQIEWKEPNDKEELSFFDSLKTKHLSIMIQSRVSWKRRMRKLCVLWLAHTTITNT